MRTSLPTTPGSHGARGGLLMIAYSLIAILSSMSGAYSETKPSASIPAIENTVGMSIYTAESTTMLLNKSGGGSLIFGSGNTGYFSFPNGTLSFRNFYEIAKAGTPATPGKPPVASLYFGTSGATRLEPFEISDPSKLLPFVAAAISGIRKNLANQPSGLTAFEKLLHADRFFREASK